MKKLAIITSIIIGVMLLVGNGGSVIAASSVDTTPVQVAVAQAVVFAYENGLVQPGTK